MYEFISVRAVMRPASVAVHIISCDLTLESYSHRILPSKIRPDKETEPYHERGGEEGDYQMARCWHYLSHL